MIQFFVSTRYVFNMLMAILLLPVLYVAGRRVLKNMPKLPEPTDTVGFVDVDAEREFQLLILGESTMAGVGVASHAEGFAGSVAQLLATQTNKNIHWQVHAKSGYTAKQIAKKIVPTITMSSADLIMIGLGANDTFTLNPPWCWQRHIRTLIQQLRQAYPHAPIIFLHMPPIRTFPALPPLLRFFMGNQAALLSNALAQTIAHYPNIYFPEESFSLHRWQQQANGSYEQLFSDGVHPSELAYGLWAKEIAKYMSSQNISI